MEAWQVKKWCFQSVDYSMRVICIEGSQNMPPQNMLLCYVDYSKLLALER